jgi:hypothetical protein
MGRPVVAEDGGSAAEAVRAGVTGWLAAERSAALAEALQSALALHRAPRRTGARGAGARAQPLRPGTIQSPVDPAVRTDGGAMRTWCLAVLMFAGLIAPAQGQIASPQARPPSGGVLDRFLAPPSGSQEDFVGTWNLTWHDPGDPACPCHGTLTIQVDESMDNAGNLKGYWSMKSGRAFDQRRRRQQRVGGRFSQ